MVDLYLKKLCRFLCCCGILALGAGPASAGTVSITSPAANAQLSCAVVVRATTVPAAGENAVSVTFYAKDASNVVVQTGSMTLDPGTTNNWSYAWNTVSLGTATFSIYASANFVNQQMMLSSVGSIPFNVTTKHGYELVADPLKSYAKVNSPAAGATIHTTPMGAWTLSTDHKLTWNKFDGCITVTVQYVFQQSSSWNTATTTKNTGTLSVMFTSAGEHFVSLLGYSANFPVGLPNGNFTADGFNFTPPNFATHHAANAFMVAP